MVSSRVGSLSRSGEHQSSGRVYWLFRNEIRISCVRLAVCHFEQIYIGTSHFQRSFLKALDEVGGNIHLTLAVERSVDDGLPISIGSLAYSPGY